LECCRRTTSGVVFVVAAAVAAVVVLVAVVAVVLDPHPSVNRVGSCPGIVACRVLRPLLLRWPKHVPGVLVLQAQVTNLMFPANEQELSNDDPSQPLKTPSGFIIVCFILHQRKQPLPKQHAFHKHCCLIIMWPTTGSQGMTADVSTGVVFYMLLMRKHLHGD